MAHASRLWLAHRAAPLYTRHARLLSTTAKRIPLYTRTGDGGESSLYTLERRQKDDAAFNALGDIDEVVACIGAAHAHCLQLSSSRSSLRIAPALAEVQSRLLDVGSAVATPPGSETSERKRKRAEFSGADAAIVRLEKWIDGLDGSLPPLTAFVLPGGSVAASQLHVARAVARRAERSVVPLVRAGDCDAAVGRYLNRLSDFLFVAARCATADTPGVEEVAYTKGE